MLSFLWSYKTLIEPSTNTKNKIVDTCKVLLYSTSLRYENYINIFLSNIVQLQLYSNFCCYIKQWY